MRTNPIAIVVTIVALVLIGYGIIQLPERGTVPDNQFARMGDNAIYVADQLPSREINVTAVVLKNGGYVVIHGGDADGSEILGQSTLLPNGDSRDVRVSLKQGVEDGEELVAMLHNDDGDGAFNAEKDLPLKDERGNTLMMSFMISSTATEEPGAVSL